MSENDSVVEDDQNIEIIQHKGKKTLNMGVSVIAKYTYQM